MSGSSVRHYIAHANLIWEVDEYEGLLKGVVLAEVELESLDQHILMAWATPDTIATTIGLITPVLVWPIPNKKVART